MACHLGIALMGMDFSFGQNTYFSHAASFAFGHLDPSLNSLEGKEFNNMSTLTYKGLAGVKLTLYNEQKACMPLTATYKQTQRPKACPAFFPNVFPSSCNAHS